MCDALSRNVPKLSAGAEALLANCLSHGRRQFVDVAENFPDECFYVLETLGAVYGTDAAAREQKLSWEARLLLHQEKSGPWMEGLHHWMTEQLNGHKTEPNSGLGKAMKYLLRHWHKLTLFLRVPGAPLDNNICERALKMVVLLRKNALFYRTQHGADELSPGDTLVHEGDPADALFVLLEGEIRGRPESGAADAPVFVRRGGHVIGMLPFSRMTHF